MVGDGAIELICAIVSADAEATGIVDLSIISANSNALLNLNLSAFIL